jgi:hypothetical protein
MRTLAAPTLCALALFGTVLAPPAFAQTGQFVCPNGTFAGAGVSTYSAFSAACGLGGAAGGGGGINPGAVAIGSIGAAFIGSALQDMSAPDPVAAQQSAAAAAMQARYDAAARARQNAIRDKLLGEMALAGSPALQTASAPGGLVIGGVPLMQADTAPGPTTLNVITGPADAAPVDAVAGNAVSCGDGLTVQVSKGTGAFGTDQVVPISNGGAAPCNAAPAAAAAPAGPPSPPAKDDAGIDPSQKVAVIPRNGDPAQIARGSRYVDCAATRVAYTRLQSGLAAQRDWLTRTKAQIDGVKSEQRALSHEERVYAVKTLFETTKDLAVNTAALKSALKDISLGKYGPLDRRTQAAILLWTKRLSTAYDAIKEPPEALKAGWNYGTELRGDAAEMAQQQKETQSYLTALQRSTKTLEDAADGLREALVDSGIAAEAGGELAKDLAGPAGWVAFTAAKIGIEAGELAARDAMSQDELLQASWQYDHLQDLYGALQDKIGDDKADLVEYCGGL